MAKLPPGCHPYLPRTEINVAMRQYLGTDGWYLLRPSFSNPGQYSICVSYHGEVKNFKINRDDGGKYSVSSKKFNSLEELLFAYSKNPFRSKKGGTEIYLLYPIPVDKALEQRHIVMHNETMNREQQQAQQHMNSGPGGPRLPPRPGGAAGPPGAGRPQASTNGRPGMGASQRSNNNMGGGGGPPPLPNRSGGAVSGRPLPTAPGPGGPGARPGADQPPLPVRRGTQSNMPQQQLQVADSRSRQRAMSQPVSNELAPGWTEFYSEEHGRPYYFQDSTGKTVWQKPVAAPQPSPQPQRASERARPLPTVPQGQMGGPHGQMGGPQGQVGGPPLPQRSSGYDADAPPLPGRQSSHGASRRGAPAAASEVPPPVSRRQTTPAPSPGRGAAPGIPQQQQHEEAPPPLPSSRGRRGAPPVPEQQQQQRGMPFMPDQGAPPPVANRGPSPGPGGRGRGDLPPAPVRRGAPDPIAADMPPPVSRPTRSFSELPPASAPSLPPAPAPVAPAPAPTPAPAPAPAPAPVPAPVAPAPAPAAPPAPAPAAPPAAAPAPPPPPPAPAAPAPPPPPPAGGAPPAPAAPSLSGIGAALQAGKAGLKKAEPVATQPDSRGDLLASIRGGAKLKKVDAASEPRPPPAVADGPAGMMGSLRSAIDNIRMAVEDSDEGDDFDEVEDDDW